MTTARTLAAPHHLMHTFTTHFMSRTLRRAVAASVTLLALAAAPTFVSAQSINLTGNETPSGPFGKGAPATFGQTFTAPTGANFLQTFSFWLSDDPQGTGNANASSMLFQAYVMQWDAANGYATGPVLFTSTVYGGPALFSQRYDFLTTNLSVTAGTQYVAILSSSAQLSNIVGSVANAAVETSLSGTYTDGSFVYADNGSDFSALSTTPWDFTGFAPDYQAHFAADFSANAVSVVPEPSSLVLLVVGLSALTVLAVRKKRV